MPSRYKKALRNSKVTNSFFNQVDTGTGPRRNERNKNHTTQPMEPDSSSDDSLPEINLGKDTLRCSVIETNYLG